MHSLEVSERQRRHFPSSRQLSQQDQKPFISTEQLFDKQSEKVIPPSSFKGRRVWQQTLHKTFTAAALAEAKG